MQGDNMKSLGKFVAYVPAEADVKGIIEGVKYLRYDRRQ